MEQPNLEAEDATVREYSQKYVTRYVCSAFGSKTVILTLSFSFRLQLEKDAMFTICLTPSFSGGSLGLIKPTKKLVQHIGFTYISNQY